MTPAAYTPESKHPIEAIHSLVETVGEFGVFTLCVTKSWFSARWEWSEFLRQVDHIGAMSLPLVALAGAATGVVLSLQTGDSLARFGAKSVLPAVIVFSLVKETGPIITGLVASDRVGAGIGAELGSMKVTEQIDAMEASAVDPLKFLAGTRVLACMLALPLLTVVADCFGIVAGWIATTLASPVSFTLFLQLGLHGVRFSDALPPTLKTIVFGWLIGIISTFLGMRTTGGTEGVGRSATGSVVMSSILIIIADVILVRLIQEIFE